MPAGSPQLFVTAPGFWGRFWWLLWRAVVGAYEDNCFGIAKGAAYSALLSFFPVLTTLATLLIRFNADAVSRVIAALLFDVIPPGTEDLVRDHFAVHGRQSNSLVAVATGLSIWAASGAMMTLMEGFQAVYRLPGGRPFLQQRAMAIVLVLSVALPVVGASALILFGARTEASVYRWLGALPGDAELEGWLALGGRATRYLMAVGSIVVAAALLYYFGPNRRQRMVMMLPGAILATGLWLLATTGFAWYVRNIANYDMLYGSIGAVIALLVWMYVLAVIALFGCEFNAVLERESKREL